MQRSGQFYGRLIFVVMTSFALATSIAHAWPGFDWNQWREITKATKPDVTSPQAGHHDLLPLLRADFDTDKKITTVDAWQAKRANILKVLGAFRGDPGNLMPQSMPTAQELGREDMGTYERIHLRIASEPDDTIPAYYLVPQKLEPAKNPVMIVLHQTQAAGKDEACGISGNPEMAFAKELTERGMLCLVPDAIGFGERIPAGGQPYDGALDFYRKHPNWSFFGKMSWDIAREIDYLETRLEVDKDRIGIIGHSHGAYGSIMGAVFEPRIKLVVASCGFTILRTDPEPNRWSHLTALLPRLGFYVDKIDDTPFDWQEIIACIAPRPYFNWATLNDDIFPKTDNLASVYEQVGELYALYGNKNGFVGRLGPGAHRFPMEAREEAYKWLKEQFSGDPY